MTPLVTIVVTTYNRPHQARAAVRSALAQTVSDIEVIAVDDGSQPPVDWSGIDDQRLRTIRHDHAGGMSRARNAGLREAKGTFITFLDDDDEYLPRMVEVSLGELESPATPPPVAVVSALASLDEDGGVRRVDVPVSFGSDFEYLTEQFFKRQVVALNTLFTKTELLRRVGGYEETLVGYEDFDLSVRLSRIGTIVAIREVTYLKPFHTGQRVSSSVAIMSRSADVLLEKHWDLLARDQRMLARFLTRVGMDHLRAGRWGQALARTGRSLLYWPTRPRGIAAFLLALVGPQVYRTVRPITLRIAGGPRAYRARNLRPVRKPSVPAD